MKPLKLIFLNIPKMLKWLIVSGCIAPILGFYIVQYLTQQPISVPAKNLIIILFIILILLIIGFVVGSLRSLKILLNDKESGFSGSLISTQKKDVLPYRSISLDTFPSDYLWVDIQAKIVLGETIDPSVDIFLERVQIGDPFCPKCNTPLDIIRASWMADSVQTGYLCKKCNTEDKRDYFELLRDVKGFVRNNFDSMWALYTKNIADLTGNKQDKYCLPSYK